MKNACLFLLLVFFFTWASAQQDTGIREHNNTLVIKGKVLPWAAMIVPGEGINYTFGLEYGFAKKNAIGIDLVYNDYNTHKDYSPVSNQGDSVGPSFYSVSRGVFLYYRRYPGKMPYPLSKPYRSLVRSRFVPYYSFFARYGKTDYHYDPGYITNNLSHDEWQYSAGFLFGFVADYFDVNFGPFYKLSYISDYEKENGGDLIYCHVRPSFGFRVGANLFYVVKKKGGHTLACYADTYYDEAWRDLGLRKKHKQSRFQKMKIPVPVKANRE